MLYPDSKFNSVNAWCIGGVASLPHEFPSIEDPEAHEQIMQIIGLIGEDLDEDEGRFLLRHGAVDNVVTQARFRLGTASDDDSPRSRSSSVAPLSAQASPSFHDRRAVLEGSDNRGSDFNGGEDHSVEHVAELDPAQGEQQEPPLRTPLPTCDPDIAEAATMVMRLLHLSSFSVAFSPDYRLYICKCGARSIGWYVSLPFSSPLLKEIPPPLWSAQHIRQLLEAIAADLKS